MCVQDTSHLRVANRRDARVDPEIGTEEREKFMSVTFVVSSQASSIIQRLENGQECL